MFDFAWSEIALIGVVALIAIGPKDLPVAIKTVASMVKKARRMAGEFQTHVDEMVREANLDDVRSQINEIRSMDIRGTIERAVDSDGSIRKAFKEDPFVTSNFTPAAPSEPVVVGDLDSSGAVAEAFGPPNPNDTPVEPTNPGSEPIAAVSDAVLPPAFIPPKIAIPVEVPSFIPPGARAAAARSQHPFLAGVRSPA